MKKALALRVWIPVACVMVFLPAMALYAGVYNIAASQEHYKLTKQVLSLVKSRSVAVRARDVTVPPEIGSGASEGAGAYAAMCAGCHGAPGQDRSFIGAGLNPLPPDLGHAAKEMSVEELFWIVKNGIKMTGMPSFGKTHRDEEIWPIITFLKELPAMDAEGYAARVNDGAGHDHAHSDGEETAGTHVDEHDHGGEEHAQGD